MDIALNTPYSHIIIAVPRIIKICNLYKPRYGKILHDLPFSFMNLLISFYGILPALKEKLQELSVPHGQYSVHVLCEALEVPIGTFYNHTFRNKGENNSYQIRRNQLSEWIKQIYEESNQIFGAKKIKAGLADQGEAVSDKMIAQLMQEMNLYSIRTEAKKDYIRFNYEKKELFAPFT